MHFVFENLIHIDYCFYIGETFSIHLSGCIMRIKFVWLVSGLFPMYLSTFGAKPSKLCYLVISVNIANGLFYSIYPCIAGFTIFDQIKVHKLLMPSNIAIRQCLKVFGFCFRVHIFVQPTVSRVANRYVIDFVNSMNQLIFLIGLF